MRSYGLFMFFVLLTMGVSYFGIGLKVLISKRPLFISSRWYFAMIAIAYVPFAFNYFFLPGQLSLTSMLMPVIFGTLLLFYWFILKGYIAIGITDEGFDNALKSALKQLNLPFEESLTRIVLASKGVELQVSIQSWIGTGQLKIKKRSKAGNELLKDIAQSMNDYFKSNQTKTNNLTAIFYLIMGVILLGISVWSFSTLGPLLDRI